MKIGFLKYIVNPPKSVIRIPPSKGTIGTFFSILQTIAKAINVAKIKGVIAISKFYPFL